MAYESKRSWLTRAGALFLGIGFLGFIYPALLTFLQPIVLSFFAEKDFSEMSCSEQVNELHDIQVSFFERLDSIPPEVLAETMVPNLPSINEADCNFSASFVALTKTVFGHYFAQNTEVELTKYSLLAVIELHQRSSDDMSGFCRKRDEYYAEFARLEDALFHLNGQVQIMWSKMFVATENILDQFGSEIEQLGLSFLTIEDMLALQPTAYEPNLVDLFEEQFPANMCL